MKIRKINFTKVSRPDQLPDIDIDFEANRRDEVKRYLVHKYGSDRVCSIGTYNGLKLKSALKDFSRLEGLQFSYVNHISSLIGKQLEYEWKDLFKYAADQKQFREYLENNADLVNIMKPVLNQSRSAAIHASAVIIVPKEDEEGNPMTIYDWMPVKLVDVKDGKKITATFLVSEWEGKYTDRAGFLKEDILGLETLDKLNSIIGKIKTTYNKKVVLRELPLDDKKTYSFYAKGWTEDIFQMNRPAFKQYARKVKPDNIEDIIAMIALWRPGPMSSNAHIDFYKIKHGEKEVVYDYGLQEVTKATQGLYIYQEQIMRAVHVLGGLSLVESDEVRTVMKKFDKVKMKKYMDKFIEGAIERKCPPKEAPEIWMKLEKFSGYGFNRSHSAAYGLMAYWTQYFKANFPVEFWTVSLQYAKDEDEVTNRISEMRLASTISIKPPNINQSTETFVGDFKANSIYWSLAQIKGLGEKGVEKIVKERDKNGEYTNITNFSNRMKGTGIGKDKLYKLILAGAFDAAYKVTDFTYRKQIITRYFDMVGEQLPEKFSTDFSNVPDFWILEQRKLTGFGDVDYKRMIASVSKSMAKEYHSPQGVKKASKYDFASVAGHVMYLKPLNYKKKKGQFCIITLACNHEIVLVIAWEEVWKSYETQLREAEKNNTVIAINGKVNYDDYREENVLNTIDNTKIYFFE